MSETVTQEPNLASGPLSPDTTSHILDSKTPATVSVEQAISAVDNKPIRIEEPVLPSDSTPKKGESEGENRNVPDPTERPVGDQENATRNDVKNSGAGLPDGVIADILSRVKWVEETVFKKAPRPPQTTDTASAIKVRMASAIKGRLASAVGTQPTVRYCNWGNFKNFFSQEDLISAIDALVLKDGEDLDEQMEQEQIRRLPPDTPPKKRETCEKERLRGSHTRNDSNGETVRFDRVRIKSQRVLEFLARVTGEQSLTERPHTFLRPFRFLIHHHQKLENEFRILEDKFNKARETCSDFNPSTPQARPAENPDVAAVDEVKGVDEQANDQAASEPPGGNIAADRPDMKVPEGEEIVGSSGAAQVDLESAGTPELENKGPDENGISDSPAVHPERKTAEELDYEHIKCYMEFARTHLIPFHHKFDKLDHVGNPKIRYEELWCLFRPGELVFEHEDSKQESESANASGDTAPHRSNVQNQEGPRVWRVEYITTEEVHWVVPNLGWTDDLRGKRSKSVTLDPVYIDVYRLDFDGEQYQPSTAEFRLDRWDGEKAITKLPVFPVRFHKDYHTILEKYRQRGAAFQKLLMKGHLAIEHDGWTLSKDPDGGPIVNYTEEEERPVYVSSDVIIDHKEALQSNPWWRPHFRQGKLGLDSLNYPLSTTYDHFTTLVWSDTKRTRAFGHMPEIVVEFDNIADAERDILAQTDDFIVDPAARDIGTNTANKTLSPDDLALLPKRLFVYSLRDRKFVNANIQCLKEITTMPDPWDELKIPPHHMDLIRSTVEDHFTKKRLQRELNGRGLESLEQDFIRSKGRGLVFLLHGPPGVGKTATAEAVAYAHRKPLFSLACFDLGVDAGTVESRLSEVFRLANLWDCVLLLDEADIFLSHREKKDDNLQRNAIVSIFLRTMEYYPGILFLTTNRPGALDEALSSRVHISLAFSDLGRSQTLEIFQMNIRRCKRIAEQRANISGEPELVINRKEIEDFAAYEFDNCVNGPFWNGRVIRNAFQIAMSLAYIDRPSDSFEETERGDAERQPAKRYLGRDQFERVLKLFNDFKNYRQIMFNKSDEKLAYERGERATTRSLDAGNSMMQDYGRGPRYGTPNQPQRMARTPRPGFQQDYPDSWSRDARDERGPRRRYDQDHDDYDRPRNPRHRSDQEYGSGYLPPVSRGNERDRDRDYPRDRDYDREHERDRDRNTQSTQRQGQDRTPPRARDDQPNLDVPSEPHHQPGRPSQGRGKGTGSQRSRTPSPSPRPGVERRDYSDDQYRRPAYN